MVRIAIEAGVVDVAFCKQSIYNKVFEYSENTVRLPKHPRTSRMTARNITPLKSLHKRLSERVEIESSSYVNRPKSVNESIQIVNEDVPQSSVPSGSVEAAVPIPISNENGNELFTPKAGVGENAAPTIP